MSWWTMSRSGHHVKRGDLVWFWLDTDSRASACIEARQERYRATGIVMTVWDSNVYEPSETEVYTTLPGAVRQTLLIKTRDLHLIDESVSVLEG